MNFVLDVSTVLQTLIVGGLLHTARVLWQTTEALGRLDERTKMQGERITELERRVA